MQGKQNIFYHTFILQKSGLSAEIGEAFKSFKDFDPLVLVLILSIITAAFTEIASNTASATIFIPILAELVCAFSYSVVLNSSAILREYRLPLGVLNLIYLGHRLLYSKWIHCTWHYQQQLRRHLPSCCPWLLHRMQSCLLTDTWKS